MTWMTLDEVCQHVKACEDIVRERMRETVSAGVEPAWIDVGSGGRRCYRFDAAAVDGWWKGIHKWRTSVISTTESGGKFAGSTPMASSGPGSARPRARRKTSSPTSRTKPHAGSFGSLVQLVRSHSRQQ